MSRTTLIHLPVADVNRSIGFYEAVGARRAPSIGGESAASVVVLGTVVVKLVPSGTVDRPSLLPCLSVESRAAVDARAEAAWDAGGRLDFTRDQDFEGLVYGRIFEDPDGHVWTVRWLDPAAVAERSYNARRAA